MFCGWTVMLEVDGDGKDLEEMKDRETIGEFGK